jgi:undecaprenyl-diphosphatase
VFLFGFLLVATQRSSFITLDLGVNAWAAAINTGSFTVAAEEISIIFDTIPMEIFTGVLVVIFTLKNRWQYGALLIGAIGGDVLIVATLKNLIMSPRPWNEVIYPTSYSFPSGHVAGNVVFFGILTYFAWSNWASARTRFLTGGLYVALIVLIGFDRIYLNVHWLSDVVGGFLLGAFWILFTLWVFNRMVRK